MELPWYPHDIQDYDESTADLTLQQHGVYRRMLDHYYRARAPLPAPLSAIHRIVGAHTAGERKDVSYILHRFFQLRADGWHNRRADEELEKARSIQRQRSEAGTASAAKRQRKSNGRSTNADTLNTEQGLETSVSKPKRASAPFVLPDWVPQPTWDDFLEMRKRIRKPATERAKQLLVQQLEKLRDAGHEPQSILENSIRNDWQDLYEPRGNGGVNGKADRPSPHETLQRATLIALDRIAERG